MQKLDITNLLSVVCYDENDYVKKNKDVYAGIQKVLSSFDDDEMLSWCKDYIENLNGDIFLSGKKFEIFLLKQKRDVVSFAVLCGGNLDMIWTHFDFAKLGFATILLRAVAIFQKDKNCCKFCANVKKNNLIAQSLMDSFAKTQNIKCKKTELLDGSLKYAFDVCALDANRLLEDIKKMAY